MLVSFRQIIIYLLIVITFNHIIIAQDSLNIEKLSSIYDNRAAANSPLVMLRNNIYLPQGINGLRLIDVNDPYNPVEIDSFNTQGNCLDVYIIDTLAFVANGDSGVLIIDIKEPREMSLVARIVEIGLVIRIAVQGNYLYIAHNQNNVIVYDFSNPFMPVEVSLIPIQPGPVEVYVSDDLAIIPTWLNGMRIVDIIDPENPNEISFIGASGSGVCIYRDMLLAADGDRGIKIFDISNPWDPMLIGSYNTPHYPVGIEIRDNLAYICDSNSGIRILDIDNPENIVEVGYYDTPGAAQHIVLGNDGIVYLADYTNLGIYRYTPNSVEDKFILRPSSFSLNAFPNPFNSLITIEYRVGSDSNPTVRLSLYDLSGRLVQTLVNERLTPGNYRTTLYANALTSGVYVVRMESDPPQPPLEKGVYSRKVVVVK